MPGSPVQYNAADVTQSSGVPDAQIRSQASPEDFGSQIGAGTKEAGDIISDNALKLQGMASETAATNAESTLIQKNASVRADYLSSEGQDAVDKQQSTLAAYNQNYQDLRASLASNPQALRAYDMLGLRRLANDTSEAITYGTSQLKKAHSDSQINAANLTTYQASDPVNANDPTKIYGLLGDATYHHGAAMSEDQPGIVQDQDGNHAFADTPEGDHAKSTLQSSIDATHGEIWQNAINTVSDTDPLKASQMYTDHKDMIPPFAQANIEANLAPKVTAAYARGYADDAMYKMQQDYHALVAAHVSGSGPGTDTFNLGNVKTAAGAANDTADFAKVASPIDGVTLATNTLRSGYQGLTLAEIGQKWAPSSENNTGDWVKNVSAASGISADTVPDLNNPTVLQNLMKGIGTAEKSPADRENFTDDVIAQGVQKSIAGEQPAMATEQKSNLPGSINPNYPKNPDGSRMMTADYFAANRPQILQSYYNKAIADGATVTTARQIMDKINLQGNQMIEGQSAQYRQTRQEVLQAITKGTNGKIPATEEELRAVPGMSDAIDALPGQDKESMDFYNNIHTYIAKNQKQNNVSNSPNAYDAIKSVADNAAKGVDQASPEKMESFLHEKLGRSDSTAYNFKDYNDAKELLPASQAWGKFISDNMESIANANGNVDGRGQERAANWANYANAQKKINDAKGDKALPDDQFIQQVQDVGPHMPSRMQQISNFVSRIAHGSTAQTATPAKVTDAASYSAIPSGTQYTDPNGVLRTKP